MSCAEDLSRAEVAAGLHEPTLMESFPVEVCRAPALLCAGGAVHLRALHAALAAVHHGERQRAAVRWLHLKGAVRHAAAGGMQGRLQLL